MTTTEPRATTAAPDGASTAALAAFVAHAAVPDAVRGVTRRYVLDWLGSAIGGSTMQPPTIVREVIEELGGREQATVFGSAARTSAPLAALANAAASHVLEMDDLDRGSVYHPAAPTVAAALALGESEGIDGDTFLDAVAVGYEVGIRVGEALGETHYDHWHTTGTAGTLGAAAAAARLLGLDERATRDALGSAGTMTAGLWEFLADGAMSKQLHPGKAAHDGILAALLARRGFTGASKILEGPKGLLAAMTDDARPERLTDGLSIEQPHWRVEGVSFKVHASCRHTHPAVDAALALRARDGFDLAAVDRIHVRVYRAALGLLEGVEPTTPYAAKFSLPFCVAAALRFGELGLTRFTDETVADAETLALADRITFAPDEELSALYPARWPSILEATLASGQTLVERVDQPRGDPDTGVTNEDLVTKFVMLTGGQVEPDRARELGHNILEGPAWSPARLAEALTRR
ncbi:MAG: MmgE/PrpD family protein [Dehalococcoidia bacterium]